MTLYDVDRRLVRGRIQVGTDTVTVDALSPEHAGEVAAHEPHGLEGNIAVSCRNVRVAPPPKAWVDEYAPVGSSAMLEGNDEAMQIEPPKRRPGRPRKAA